MLPSLSDTKAIKEPRHRHGIGSDAGTSGDYQGMAFIAFSMPKSHRITVQGVNLRKRHQSQYQTQGRTLQPGIVEFEAPIQISNVMLVCPSCDEPSRIGIRREDGEAVRICKRCESEID